MAVLHRALFTWFLFMVFMVLLVLRLDERTDWNWFIVFIPMWFYNAILLMYISIHMVNDCRHAGIGGGVGPNNRIHGHYYRIKGLLLRLLHMFAVVLKVTFMVILCLRLEGSNIGWSIVFTPLLLLLVGLCVNVFHYLVLQWRDEDY